MRLGWGRKWFVVVFCCFDFRVFLVVALLVSRPVALYVALSSAVL